MQAPDNDDDKRKLAYRYASPLILHAPDSLSFILAMSRPTCVLQVPHDSLLGRRFRRIAQLYSQGIKPLAHNSLELSNWNWLYNATDKLTKGWLKHGARLLQQVTASAKASSSSNSNTDDTMQRVSSTCSSSSSWQSACGDAFGHTMMDQHLTKLMQKTSGSGGTSMLCLLAVCASGACCILPSTRCATAVAALIWLSLALLQTLMDRFILLIGPHT